MKLNEIADNPGAKHARKRRGRGIGSGLGKTSGRGGKGQTARSGGAKAGFEGGQMPIYRRLPKRGFNKPNKVAYNEVTLGRLQGAFDSGKIKPDGAVVTLLSLTEAGVISKAYKGIRLVGSGELTAKLVLEVWYATKSAIEAVEKAGGSVKILRPEPEPKKVFPK